MLRTPLARRHADSTRANPEPGGLAPDDHLVAGGNDKDSPGAVRRRHVCLATERTVADRAGQRRGDVVASVSAAAIATLLGAVGDGLLLHVLLDADLDTRAAIDARSALLRPRASPPDRGKR